MSLATCFNLHCPLSAEISVWLRSPYTSVSKDTPWHEPLPRSGATDREASGAGTHVGTLTGYKVISGFKGCRYWGKNCSKRKRNSFRLNFVLFFHHWFLGGFGGFPFFLFPFSFLFFSPSDTFSMIKSDVILVVRVSQYAIHLWSYYSCEIYWYCQCGTVVTNNWFPLYVNTSIALVSLKILWTIHGELDDGLNTIQLSFPNKHVVWSQDRSKYIVSSSQSTSLKIRHKLNTSPTSNKVFYYKQPANLSKHRKVETWEDKQENVSKITQFP